MTVREQRLFFLISLYLDEKRRKMPFLIVIPEQVIEQIRQSSKGRLYGIFREEERVAFIKEIDPPTDHRYIYIGKHTTDREDFSAKDRVVLLVEGGKVRALAKEAGRLQEVKIEVVSLLSDIYKRHQGILDTGTLLKKTVCLVGLGSVGSSVALWLAKSGVGNFRLVDFDRLSSSNICRHVCGIEDVGRYKTRAVRDLLLNRNWTVSVSTFEVDVTNISGEEKKEIFEGCDLIIASTDSNLAQFCVNRISLSFGIPALFIGCYGRAFGGEIIYVIPGATACFNCAFEARVKNLKPITQKKTSLAYTTSLTESQADRLEAIPGLAIDIDYIVASAMPYALALLKSDAQRQTLLDFKRNIIFVSTGNKPQWIFERPFQRIVGIPEKGCSVCLGDEYYRLSEEEALEKLEIEKRDEF